MTAELVSVIIPAHNAARTIGEALQAIADQNYPAESIQTIVVDDGSTDKTRSIALSKKAKVVTVLRGGLAAARNTGAHVARGRILIFINADCRMGCDFVSKAVAQLEKQPNSLASGIYKTDSRSISARLIQIEFDQRTRAAETADIAATSLFACVISAQDFADCGGFRQDLPDRSHYDNEFSLRLKDYQMRTSTHNDLRVWRTHEETVGGYISAKFSEAVWYAKRSKLRMNLRERLSHDSTLAALLLAIVGIVVGNAALPGIWPLAFIPLAGYLLISAVRCWRAFVRDPEAGFFCPWYVTGGSMAYAAGMIAGGYSLWKDARNQGMSIGNGNSASAVGRLSRKGL